MATLLGVALGAVITFAGRESFNSLRHHLTLGLLLGLAAAINIVSFLLFVGFWTVYRWLKPERDQEPPI